MKTVLSDNEVIRTCNLHIAVRSAIGNKSIVWQDFVRIDKVYENFKKLNYEWKNPLYQDIPLPDTLQEFKALYFDKEELVSTVQLDNTDENDMPTQSTSYQATNITDAHVDSISDNIDTQSCDIEPGTYQKSFNPSFGNNDIEPVGVDKASDQQDLSTINDSIEFPLIETSAVEGSSNSFLTRASVEDMMSYDQCTIMDMNRDKVEEEITSYWTKARIDGQPLKSHVERDLDLMCFQMENMAKMIQVDKYQ